MLETIFCCTTGFLAGLLYVCLGAGAAVIYMCIWLFLNSFHLIPTLSNFIACQSVLSCQECFLSAILFMSQVSKIKWRIAKPIMIIGAATSILGAQILFAYGDNVFLRRGLGVTFLIAFFVQIMESSTSSHSKTYSFDTWFETIAILTAFMLAGLLGGICGLTLPPLIILVTYFDYRRDNQITYCAGFYMSFNWCRMGYFIWSGKVDGLFLYFCIIIISATFGFLTGKKVASRISQEFFIRMLRAFLLSLGCTFSVYASPVESYFRFLPIFLLSAVIIYSHYVDKLSTSSSNLSLSEKLPLLNQNEQIQNHPIRLC